MTEHLLECENITKKFGGLVAVDRVNLHIDTDGICGLIGPNGAGKTTLFNVVSGALDPTDGRVVFQGEDITDEPQHAICQSGISRSFQTPRPFESLSVLENVLVGQRFGRGHADTDEAYELLDLTELEHRADENPADLTVVEQKRLDLCRALSTDPDLLLLDEIMAGLNPTETSDFLDFIREISTGRGVFVIEHDMDAIMNISDRIVVLESGTKIADGPPQEVATDEDVIRTYLGEAAPTSEEDVDMGGSTNA
jgi:branched-chain amino acid transport system ATP-binding protein